MGILKSLEKFLPIVICQAGSKYIVNLVEKYQDSYLVSPQGLLFRAGRREAGPGHPQHEGGPCRPAGSLWQSVRATGCLHW